MIRWLQPLAAAAILIAVFLSRSLINPPDPLAGYTRLVLVETIGFEAAQASLRRFERRSADGEWREVGTLSPVTVGRAGLGWGHTFRHAALAGEPIKQEGDKKAPAGIFWLGRPFGHGDSDIDNYMQLKPGQHVCVDEPASRHYSRIVTEDVAGRTTSGERMWTIPIYKHGIVIDYPTRGSARSGSCIFIHVWRDPGVPTVGCVAAAPEVVTGLQAWAARAPGRTAIAILPAEARARLGLSLP